MSIIWTNQANAEVLCHNNDLCTFNCRTPLFTNIKHCHRLIQAWKHNINKPKSSSKMYNSIATDYGFTNLLVSQLCMYVSKRKWRWVSWKWRLSTMFTFWSPPIRLHQLTQTKLLTKSDLSAHRTGLVCRACKYSSHLGPKFLSHKSYPI